MDWKELTFYLVLLLIFFGAFDGLRDIVKLWINRRYDAKIAQAQSGRVSLDKEGH